MFLDIKFKCTYFCTVPVSFLFCSVLVIMEGTYIVLGFCVRLFMKYKRICIYVQFFPPVSPTVVATPQSSILSPSLLSDLQGLSLSASSTPAIQVCVHICFPICTYIPAGISFSSSSYRQYAGG